MDLSPILPIVGKSIAFLRRILLGLPKISVTGGVATVLGPKLREVRVVITAINDGAAAVQVSGLSLRSRDGGFIFIAPTDLDRGPRLPVELAALGGRAVWMLDYAAVRDAAARVVRDTSPEVRATVKIGTRTYEQSDTVTIALDGVPDTPAPFLRRIKGKWMSTVSRYVFVHPGVVLEGVDLVENTTPLHITKRGWGVSRPSTRSLIVRHASGKDERVPAVPPILIPRMWRPRTLILRVPLVDDTFGVPTDSFWWLTTSGKSPGAGHGAHRRSEIVAAMTEAGLIGPTGGGGSLTEAKEAPDPHAR